MSRSLVQVRNELKWPHCEEQDGALIIKPQFRHVGCPYCDVVDCKPYHNARLSKGLNYVRCRRCGLVYPLPRLNRSALKERADSPALNAYLECSLDAQAAITPGERKEIDFLDRVLRFSSRSRVLEVGCGSGSFLKGLIERGCAATGVEPNTTLAAFCQAQGLNVVKDFFEAGLPLEPGFDLIVFRESLYHLFSIKEALALARELLRDEGWLYVKAFNVDSPAIRYLRRASGGINGLDIPVNFSPRSLAWILGDAGFEPVKTVFFDDNVREFVPLPRGLPGLNRLLSGPLRLFGMSRNFGMLSRSGAKGGPR